MRVIPYPAVKSLEADVLAAGGSCIGCYVENGKIVPALSPRKLNGYYPTGVYFGAAIQPSGRLVVCNEEGFHYSVMGEGFIKSDSGVTASEPFAFHPNGENSCLVGDGKCLLTGTASSVKKPFNGNIFGGVFKNGRLFGIDRDNPFIIRWSGEGGLDFEEKIDGAGWLEVNAAKGKILGLAVYGDAIVGLCRFGLFRLTAYGMPENFKLQYIDGVTDEIIKNTAAVAGGKLAFLTTAGLCVFDGSTVENKQIDLFNDAGNPVCAVSLSDEYFLSAYSKRLKKRVVFVADIRKGTAYIADADASAMMVSGKVHCMSDDGHFVLAVGGEFTFESEPLDFGTVREKRLKSIHLGNSEEAEVTVESGGKSRIFRGVSGYLRPHMRGKTFKITVRGRGQIAGVYARAEVYDGI